MNFLIIKFIVFSVLGYEMLQEGTVKFKQEFTNFPPLPWGRLQELDSWRTVFYRLGLIGQDTRSFTRTVYDLFKGEDSRMYGGVGYGNLSQRFGPHFEILRGKRGFIITGTETEGIERLTREHYTIVCEYDPENNLIVSRGPIGASSESMTHGAVYDSFGLAGFVFHVHSSEMWRNRERLKILTTREDVEYGTPEMAEEVARLFVETDVYNKCIFAIGSHEDGIVSFGQSSSIAGRVIIDYLARSLR